MSAFRALRQLNTLSHAARPALRVAPRVTLARVTVSRIAPAARAFSSTARARGDGSCKFAQI
jgi:hypothetical protein